MINLWSKNIEFSMKWKSIKKIITKNFKSILSATNLEKKIESTNK